MECWRPKNCAPIPHEHTNLNHIINVTPPATEKNLLWKFLRPADVWQRGCLEGWDGRRRIRVVVFRNHEDRVFSLHGGDAMETPSGSSSRGNGGERVNTTWQRGVDNSCMLISLTKSCRHEISEVQSNESSVMH